MYHIVALVVAAALWVAGGVYSFAKPRYRKPWRIALFVLGGAVLAWYEIHMFWYWLALGVVLVLAGVFDRLFLASEK